MIKKSDAEISELLGVSRVSVTRWRTGKRYPKFDEIIKYEEELKLPFECFINRNPNLDEIRNKLEMQLELIKKEIESLKN
ncbi:helix-turn-helix domain-containing protein [Arcobacter aquimarinus]|uniref:helix-turn-helix domain-containing protein n=1 Tax=Arcobacter aquimarinus TaxID=1315211 RepID=UPI003BB108C1